MSGEIISIREYARRKSMSDTYIHRMIKNGIITDRSMTTHPDTGKPAIFFSFAEEDWAMNYSTKRELTPQEYRKPKNPNAQPKPPRPPAVENGTLPDGRKSKAEIDRLNAELKMQLTAIELKAKKGQYVDKESVYRSLFAMGQEVRMSFLSLPDRIVDEVMGATDRNAAHISVSEIISSELEKLSNVLNRPMTNV